MKGAGIIGAIIVLAVVGAVIWWEMSLWQECRVTNSFFYCLRVLGR